MLSSKEVTPSETSPKQMITFLKIIAVILLLLAMVIVLLSVRNLSKHIADDAKATEELKREFKESKGVITKHSVFHEFLGGHK